MWHPLWFPAFGDQSGGLVALQLEPDRPGGIVWGYHSEGGELLSDFDSTATLFRTSLALWQSGEIHEFVFMTDGQWAALAAHNPQTRTADGRWQVKIDIWSTGQWPDEWKQVLGIGPMIPADDSEIITIAELIEDPACGRPIQGAVRGLAGGGGWDTWAVEDATGRIQFLTTRGVTENARELNGMGNRYEITLIPQTHGTPLPPMSLAEREALPEVECVARRILEQSSASFLATKVIPLREQSEGH